MKKEIAAEHILKLVKTLYRRTKLNNKICLKCYLNEIKDIINRIDHE